VAKTVSKQTFAFANTEEPLNLDPDIVFYYGDFRLCAIHTEILCVTLDNYEKTI